MTICAIAAVTTVGFSLSTTRCCKARRPASPARGPRLARSVSTWLPAIARYKALSARRRRTDAELDDELASSLADPGDDPELVLQKKNRAEALRQSLARLSLEHREVIDLVYYHGKSVKEVAEIVGRTVRSVEQRRKSLAASAMINSRPNRVLADDAVHC